MPHDTEVDTRKRLPDGRRNRPSMQHVLRWLSYHTRPMHHRDADSQPPPAASLKRPRRVS